MTLDQYMERRKLQIELGYTFCFNCDADIDPEEEEQICLASILDDDGNPIGEDEDGPGSIVLCLTCGRKIGAKTVFQILRVC